MSEQHAHPQWRRGTFGAIRVREITETELWASRGDRFTTLHINETGKPPRIFSIPNPMADRLAACLLGDNAND